jgi:hypothetical protein
MADYNVTLSNTLNVFGGSPSSKWGDMLWGENWGEGSEDLPVDIEKVLSESLSLDSSVSKEPEKVISEQVTVTSETTYEDLRDGNGYYYVFPKPTTDAEQRNLTTWTEATEDTETYTSQAATTTTWSE